MQRLSFYERKLKEHASDDLDTFKDDDILQEYNKASVKQWESMFTSVAHRGILEERGRKRPPLVEPMFSIRRKIRSLETIIAPELDIPQNVFGEPCEPNPILSYQYYPDFLQRKWSLILQKQDNHIVKQLIKLMETAHVPQDTFIQTLARFSFVPLKDIHMHARSLPGFSPKQVKYSMQRHFSLDNPDDPDLAIKSITHVLMKVTMK